VKKSWTPSGGKKTKKRFRHQRVAKHARREETQKASLIEKNDQRLSNQKKRKE